MTFESPASQQTRSVLVGATDGWPGLERLREVPECTIHANIGASHRSIASFADDMGETSKNL
ncbi:MAG: hypothetical protein WCJ09_25225, partial [Planctomycetota bacterium]